MTNESEKAMSHPKVSIIILNWNGLEDTLKCLESLKRITYPNYEVVVVDNGSKGNDTQVIQQKFGSYIYLIKNDDNYGYAGGNNIGMRHVLHNSAANYLLILNNDVIVAPDFLDHMVEVANDAVSIGVVGPKVYYYHLPDRIQSAGAEINMWAGHSSSIGTMQIDTGQYDELREVDYAPGTCLLIKKDVIQKVGMFDESYFCYWEETDYCVRVRQAGYRVIYVPLARIWHKTPVKEKIWDKTLSSSKTSGLPYYYMARNNFMFMKKHATRWQYYSFFLYFFCCHLWFMTGACLLYHRDTNRLAGFYCGVKDGLLGKSGPST